MPEVGVSCCVLVLVNQATKDIAATQPAQARRTPHLDALRWQRRRMGQAAVRAALAVMLDVPAQNANKRLATHDQQLVKTLPADRGPPIASSPPTASSKRVIWTYDTGAECFATAAGGVSASGAVAASTPDIQIVAKAMDCAGAAHRNGTILLYEADAKGDDLKAKYG